MKEIQVAYVCDGKGCEKGCGPNSACLRTLDIWHAKNFVYLGDGKFVEKDSDMNEQLTNESVETTDISENVANTKNPEEAKKNFKKLDNDSQRFYNLLHTLFNMCTLAGFRIEGRVKIRDLKTGKVWE